ncbi:autotransporter-associated beta strand repeat-containing protein [Paraburkholderia sp. ZP32-5]|uniref:autotransporter-associated beta strand repeat-containing protein n=1 Tax=Paraburkholderia sp. ZP32-5 TaxID=2883245 RepID=UPI001F212CDF|nr:autotransporter-associated beta strand repeat-containing protein [Paraburkholderia sp. ZP32-5]
MTRLAASLLVAFAPPMLLLGVSRSAFADCTLTDATTITCAAGTNTNSQASATNDVIYNVDPTAVISVPPIVGGAALNLSGNGITLNNQGSIDPVTNGGKSIVASGAVLGTSAPNAINVNNETGGVLNGLVNIASLMGFGGQALIIQNGAGATGIAMIDNAGSIGMSIFGVGTFTAADAPAILSFGGGETSLTNTGTITGRIGFAAPSTSGQHNTLTNAGTINGSVYLGDTTGGNTFTAVSGSQVVDAGVATAGTMTVGASSVKFAAAGIVDAGSGSGNTLILQNSASGTGSGTTGPVTTISSSQYLDFQNLVVNSGTWTLQGDLVSGGATINDGLVSFNSAGAFGSSLTANGGGIESATAGEDLFIPIALSGASFSLQGTNPFTLSGNITGGGALNISDTAPVTLNGANTFGGGVTLSSGGLVLGNPDALGSGTLTVTGTATLDTTGAFPLFNEVELDPGASLTLLGSHPITLLGLVEGSGDLGWSGSGTLSLSEVDLSSGAFTVLDGTLAVSGGGELSPVGALRLAPGTTLDITLGGNQRVGSLAGAGGTVNLGVNTLTLNGFGDTEFDGTIVGLGGLIKNGSGTQTLGGANVFSGGVQLNAGGLAVGNNAALGSGALSVNGPATLAASVNGIDLTNTITIGTGDSLTVQGGNALTLGGTILGSGTLNLAGPGRLTLSGVNSYSATTLSGGTLMLGNANAIGAGAVTVNGSASLDTSTDLTLNNAIALNANLSLTGTNNLTLDGVLSGTGGLIKNGAATLVLGGTNTFSGALTVEAGTVQLTATGALSASNDVNLLNAGADLDVSGVSAPTIGALSGVGGTSVLMTNGLTLGSADNGTFAGTIDGAGGIVKQGSGKETLTGTNNFTGTVTIADGTLAIGVGGLISPGNAVTLTGTGATFDISGASGDTTISDLSGTAGTVALGAHTLSFGTSADQTFGGAITGTGGIIKQGSGTETLSGANTLTGTATVDAGTLALSGAGTLTSTTGVNLVNAGAAFDVSNATGTPTIGALTGVAGTNVTLGATTLTLGDTENATFGGTIDGTGGIIKQGSGTETLIGTNTYTGGTTIDAGTLAIGAGGNIAADGGVTLNGTGAKFDISGSGANQTVGALSGVAGSTIALGGNTLTFGDATNQTLASDVTGTSNSAALVKQGAGDETLSGNNNFSGGTTLDAGGLIVGSNNALGTGALTVNGAATLGSSTAVELGNDVVLNAGLTFAGANDLTLDGALSGTGGLTKQGTGTLTLNGANTYTGGTEIDVGTLALGANASLAALGIVDIASGATLDLSAGSGTQTVGTLTGAGTVDLGAVVLTVGGATDSTFSGSIGGSGSLDKVGTSTETLTGANTYTGGTTIDAGTLALGAGGSLAADGAVTLNGAGTAFDISGSGANQTIGALNGSGGDVTLGANTLTFGDGTNHTFGGSISGNGDIVKQGAGIETLTGTNTYTGGTAIDAGTLALGTGGSLASGSNVTLNGTGAEFDISGSGANQTVGALSGVAGSTVALGANSLTFGDATNQTLASNVTGTGGLVKQGSGVTTLSGNNNYSGGTTLDAGGLIVGSNTALGTGTLTVNGAATLGSSTAVELTNDVVLNAGLTFTGANNLTLDGVLSGTGGLTKQGTGTLTLNGANTYRGGTQVDQGTLALGANASLLASGTVNIASGAILDLSAGNGTQTVGTLTGAGAVDIGANLTTLGGATDGTFSGSIIGSGSVDKVGSGTETLTGANTYTGGTTIDAGTLALGVGGSLAANGTVTLSTAGARFDISGGGNQTIGALSGVAGTTVDLGARTLSVAGNGAANFGGSLAGLGGFTVAGGQQTLSGLNTYSGATSIASGATLLLTGTGSIVPSSVVADAGTFDISGATTGVVITNLSGAGVVKLGSQILTLSSPSGTFGGTFSGTGSLRLAGNDSLLLTGNSGAFGGSTVLMSGQLEVGDASTPTAALGGTVRIDPGATLRGHGTVGGDVTNNGTVMPGGSIGTLTVGGNYTQTNGSTLAIEVSPTAASQLKVNGSATLNGVLAITYDPGTYTAKSYTLVSAAGGVSGTFSSTTSTGTSNLGTLAPSISYGANGVDLALANAATGTGGSGGSTPQVVAPVDTSIYTALGTTAILGAHAQGGALLERLSHSAVVTSSATPATPTGWVNATGSQTNVGGTNGAPGFQSQRYGFLAGLERKLGDYTVGVAAGYDHADIDEQNTGDSGTTDTLRAALYGARSVGAVNLAATLGVGLDFLSQKRPFGALDAEGDHMGQEFNLGGQASLPMQLGSVTVTPSLGLRYAYFHANGFSESGAGGQDLNVGTDNVRSLQPYAQVALDHAFGDAFRPVQVEVRVGYAHELLDANRAISVAAQDGTLFTAPGTTLPRGYLTAGAGVTMHPAANLDVSLNYDGLINTTHASAQQGSIRVNYRF